ncbi:hypothetical protein O181_097738 [Austropuccinia psidii MF-1]|uniref:Uncharacterized protein n=1 Tax=Austropuccinia psidii MF-1 TaxID=1389203 RepID=A0A9Q3J7Z4_9BASI|nr:hypothetical protein [Austropuccinia psidii MF-1]
MEAIIQSNQMDLEKEEARPNTHLEVFLNKDMSGGCQSFPHSPRSVPTNFDVSSEPELIEGNILGAEPFPSGSNRNISVPIQKLVQSSKRRGVENLPKPFSGGHELLLTHQELTGTEEGNGNDFSFGERRPSGIYQLQNSSRSVQRQAQRTSEEEERSQEPSRKEKRKSQLEQTLPTGVQDPQIKDFNKARNLMELTAKEQERMNRTFPHK